MAALPSGTVTFLFTDIAGSTARWEQQPAAMRQALAQHDAILRQIITAHGGYIFKTVGDAFYAAFTNAADAVAVALTAQQALQATPWPHDMALRVRMALHSGTADERAGDYFGPTLNRVARLLSAGHGGQILLSTATHELARDSLPPDAVMQDLGTYRLKDLTRPERIFQLTAPALPTAFPPLRTLDSRPNNLPLQRTALIGRERELRELKALICRSEVGLVTLTGVGGTGKTRLALQLAAELLDDFPDGVWFVDLSPLTEPALVPDSIARSLDLSVLPGQPPTDVLSHFVRERRMLIVLDNVEQVIMCAPFVAELLNTARHLKVLVTSRMPLHLRDEHEYLVQPLTVGQLQSTTSLDVLTQFAAVRLFIERAVAAKSDFLVTNETAPAVAEICARLDGLPLAIELAAARSKLFSPPALLRRLQQRLTVLIGARTDVPPRQQTLRNAIDWSYDLLDAAERSIFEQLAIFIGGCTIEAAAMICQTEHGQPADVTDMLVSLVDKSLLLVRESASGEPRFTMLETIREYAAERLSQRPDAAAVRHRHTTYFEQLAAAAEEAREGPDVLPWLNTVEHELDNVRAVFERLLDEQDTSRAVQLANNLVWFLGIRGHINEAIRWLERALSFDRLLPLDVHAHGLANLADLLNMNREGIGKDLVLAEESLALARRSGDTAAIVRAIQAVALIGAKNGAIERARDLYDEAIPLAERSNNVRAVNNMLGCLGLLELFEGRMDQAESIYTDTLKRYRQVGNMLAIAGVTNDLGELARARGDLHRAAELYGEALTTWERQGNRIGLALVLCNLGYVSLHRGESMAAEAYFLRALTHIERGFRVLAPHALTGLAGVLCQAPSARSRMKAAHLIGASQALREHMQILLEGPDEQDNTWIETEVRTHVGDAVFHAGIRAGRELTLEQAIRVALDADASVDT